MNENTYTPPPVPQPQSEPQPAPQPDEQPTTVLGEQPAPATPQGATAPQQPGAYPPPQAGYQPGAYPPPQAGYQQPGSYSTAYAPAPARRLLRSRSDRMIGGVCGGLARYWNTDPVLLRILTVVLTLATGGAFLVGYIIAWIAIPDEPMGPYAPFGQSPRADQVGYAAGGNPPYSDQSGYAAYAEPAPRQRSYLGWLIVSAAILVAGVLGLIGLLVPTTPQFWGILGGVAVTILGVGLLVGAWYGRARWLAFLAVPLAFLTFGAVAAGNWVTDNPNWERWSEGSGTLAVGDRTWVVSPDDVGGAPLSYRLSAGEATLDLTDLTALGVAESGQSGQRVEIDAGVGLGQLVVLIPADMVLDLDATVDVGEIGVPGEDRLSGSNLSLETTIEPLATGQPAYIVTLDAAIGAGNLEVRRAQA
jgi:phage shock protein PspC (stress-responsive transcriptional regulator)